MICDDCQLTTDPTGHYSQRECIALLQRELAAAQSKIALLEKQAEGQSGIISDLSDGSLRFERERDAALARAEAAEKWSDIHDRLESAVIHFMYFVQHNGGDNLLHNSFYIQLRNKLTELLNEE